jgi:peptidoglycan-N-acetylglucosamine deacetylase
MSYYRVPTESSRRRPSRALALIAVVAFAAILLSGWSASRPVTVVIDGREERVPVGSTIAELDKNGMLRSMYGNLVAVDGSLIATSGGEPPIIMLNGESVVPSQRVSGGDVLESRSGPDVRESLLVTETVVPSENIFEGKGPIVELKRLGSPGLLRVTRGSLSGIEVTSTVLVEAVDTVFIHTRPRPGTKVVALTFDDGPVKGQTDKILDILKREEVPATFFFIGSYVEARPKLVRRTIKEGHQVANHTYSHLKLTGRTPSVVSREVVKGDKAIRAVTGKSSKWFRPPYGAMDDIAWQELRKLKKNVVLWDVDPQDWKRPGVDAIVENVVSNVKPGSVVLLHDGGPDRRQTIAALPKIIEQLREKGYIFVTLEDAVAAK